MTSPPVRKKGRLDTGSTGSHVRQTTLFDYSLKKKVKTFQHSDSETSEGVIQEEQMTSSSAKVHFLTTPLLDHSKVDTFKGGDESGLCCGTATTRETLRNCSSCASGGLKTEPTSSTVSSVPESSKSRPVSTCVGGQNSLAEDGQISWSGCLLRDICFGPSSLPILPQLAPSQSHSVLIHTSWSVGKVPQPFPAQFRDIWDSNHVKMPCSKQSIYPVETSASNEKVLLPRWGLILQSFEEPIYNSHQLENAIMNYNSRYLGKWKFDGLHAYFKERSIEQRTYFFNEVLPRLIKLALQLPQIVTHAIPLLKKQENYSITLSQQQVACLLANAFLCTFPRRNATGISSEYSSYPSINFNTLFSSDAPGKSISSTRFNKLTCICHYFDRVTSRMPDGVLTFQRKVLVVAPSWENSTATFTNLHVDSTGTIESNGHGMIQVDFANKYIGGGVLSGGCVQEEIRFLISPELIISRLFTENLDCNETLEITGPEMYSTYKGYASSFEWSGNYHDTTIRDKWRRRQTTVLAMDALVFTSKSAQYRTGMLRRELNKAYCGFSSGHVTSPSGKNMAIATGNWGCGAFGGDSRLKCLLQLMAAAQAKRDVVYFTFGDEILQKDISRLYSALLASNCTVGEVWAALQTYTERQELYIYLQTLLRKTVYTHP